MKTLCRTGCLLFLLTARLTPIDAAVLNPPPPLLTQAPPTNSQQHLQWTPYPAAEQFRIFSAPDAGAPFTKDLTGAISGYDWTAPLTGRAGFHRLSVTTLSSNALLTATVLNRLAYGPTPDELERVRSIGPQAYIDEQLAMEAITETIDFDAVTNTVDWVKVTATGTATSSNFFIYLSAAGSVYVDDIVLVKGTNAEQGVNLIQNGDFETDLTGPWQVTSNFLNSVVSTNAAHSGNSSLQVVATAAGAGAGNSIFQVFPRSTASNTATQQYALTFWYLPDTNASANLQLTVRLSGSLTVGTVNVKPPTPPVLPSTIYARLTNGVASIQDLRAWHLARAVKAKTQLLEVLVTFFDNHFNTQYSKTKQWFDDNYSGVITNDTERAWLATDFEFREIKQWRQALLDPNCTFYDLLKISANSPAMMIYLDSVVSSKSSPNENYPREVMELFTMGADNGYLQGDIVELAKAWTGWRVAKKAPENANDVFAPPVANYTNDVGVWVLHFATNSHNTGIKRMFTNNVVPARFGPPYGGQSYALILNNGGGNNGFHDGEQVITHLANLPFTQEYLSVKLCRLFVNENFDFGVYDYTSPNLPPEGKLVKDCMTAWQTPGPDGRTGNLRSVLRTIFNSALFRGHGASQQKVKSPIELTVSAVRAIRGSLGDGRFSADTDGYGISGTSGTASALNRMGNMNLFDRPEPDGYPEFGRLWLNTANLCERMRFCEHLLMPTASSSKNTDYGSPGLRNVSDPVALLKLKLPAAQWNDAGAVADYFLGIILPGEGKANLDLDRTAAINFLNLNEGSPATPSPFLNLDPGSAAYDGRVRGMVGLLMTFPRFQEQ